LKELFLALAGDNIRKERALLFEGPLNRLMENKDAHSSIEKKKKWQRSTQGNTTRFGPDR